MRATNIYLTGIVAHLRFQRKLLTDRQRRWIKLTFTRSYCKARKTHLNAFLLIIVISIISKGLSAQPVSNQINTVKPEVGKPMPNFTLNNITYYKTTKASLDDFKGKWLFLDFWFTGCVSCIQSLPKINSYHKQFKSNLNWVMVGLNDAKYNKGIEEFYEKIRARQNLQMPAAYDSLLAKKWEIHAMPHIIIVDPHGTVRHITDGRDMTEDKIESLLDGKNVFFHNISNARPSSDPGNSEKLKDIGREEAEVLYQSTLLIWNRETQSGGMEIERWVKDNAEYRSKGYSFTGVPLYWLYNHAYRGRTFWPCDHPSYGTIYPKPVLELADFSQFHHDFETGNGLYNYNLILPPSRHSVENIMQVMQEDLNRVFGHRVTNEVRTFPVWKLIAKPGVIDKLTTKGGDKFASPGTHAMGFSVRNWPSSYLIGFISFYVQEKFSDPYIPFVDDTGLVDNFDFTLDADMTNIDSINAALQQQGLQLVKGTKQMDAIVIKDFN